MHAFKVTVTNGKVTDYAVVKSVSRKDIAFVKKIFREYHPKPKKVKLVSIKKIRQR